MNVGDAELAQVVFGYSGLEGACPERYEGDPVVGCKVHGVDNTGFEHGADTLQELNVVPSLNEDQRLHTLILQYTQLFGDDGQFVIVLF